MKCLVPLLLLACSNSVHASDALARSAEHHPDRWSVGISVAPEYGFRTLQIVERNSATEMIYEQRNNRERPKLCYTAGLNVGYRLTRSVSFESGILYSRKGYKTKTQDLNFYPPDPGLPVSIRHVHNFHYLDIPLRVNLMRGTGKLRFVSGIGITANVLMKVTKSSFEEFGNGSTKSSTVPDQYDYRKFNLSPMLSAGVDYRFNDRMSLRAEPMVKYGVLRIVDAPLTTYLWTAGLNVACLVSLR